MKDRQQSSTSYPMSILLVLASDHVTGATGLAPTVTISKNGAAFGSPSGAVTEIASGWYSLAGNATDRNTLGELLVHVTGTGADPFDDRYTVVPWNPFDANQGLTNLDAAVSTRSTYAGGDTSGTTTLLTRVPGTVQPQTGDAYARLGAAGAGLTALGDTRIANLDAAVSSRSTYAGGDTSGTATLLTRVPGTVQPQTGDAYARIGAAGAGLTALGDTRIANLDATISSRSTYAGGAVASVTAAVTVGTNNDKTGYALAAGEHTLIASDAQTGLTAQGYTTTRAGYLDTLNGLVAAVWASGTRTLTSFGTVVADMATAVWAAGARTLSAFGFTVNTDVSATVTTNLDTTVGSRSTYAGTDTPGTTTLLTRVAVPATPRTAQQKQFDVP